MHTRIAQRVVARFLNKAMEHDSPEALKKYLHDHPGADKSKHKVKKQEESKGEGKDDDMTPKPGRKEQELGGEIQQWQGPGTPAINSVGSYLTGGHPVSKTKVREAIKELEGFAGSDPDAKKLIGKMKKLIGEK